MTAEPQARTYGGWRRPASPGLGRLTLLPTAALFVGLITATTVLTAAGPVAGLVTSLLIGLLLTPLVIKVADRPAWREVVLRCKWWRACRAGSTVYRSGAFGSAPSDTTDAVGRAGDDDGHRLPGMLAASQVWAAQDSLGRPFALIEHPFANQWAVALAVNPNSGALISSIDRDIRVAHWDAWLAGLGREPGIDQVAVVLDQVPDTGRVLQASVENAIVPDCPPFAARVMREAAQTYPTGGAEINCHLTITFSGRTLQVPAGGDRRSAADIAAVEIGTRLPGLARALAGTGAGAGRPVTVQELAARVRGWYDPFVQHALADAEALGQDAGIDWEQSGPVAAQETWDTYRHDSGMSRTLEMVAPPRGTVYDDVLTPLIGPMPAAPHKRVTLLYRPVDSAEAPGALDLQVRAAMNRAGRRSGVVHAHDSAEVRAALQAAAEEASGAGVVNFTALVTVTVDGDTTHSLTELTRATEAVTRAGRAAQLRLRPVTGAQAFAFSTGLGVGLSPSHLSFVPVLLRANT